MPPYNAQEHVQCKATKWLPDHCTDGRGRIVDPAVMFSCDPFPSIYSCRADRSRPKNWPHQCWTNKVDTISRVYPVYVKDGRGEEGKAERDGNVKGKGKEAKRLTGWLFIQNDLEMATAIFCTTRPTNRNRPIAKTSVFFIQFGCSLVWGLILG